MAVSSTAHLVLVGRLLGLQSAATFDVFVQIGAILAIISVYFHRLIAIVTALPASREATHFAAAIILSFLPAAVIGTLAHDFILVYPIDISKFANYIQTIPCRGL